MSSYLENGSTFRMWKLLQILTLLVITTQNNAEIRQFGDNHINRLIDLHNQARAATGAADMPEVTWNDEMAAFAASHSEKMTMGACALHNFDHSLKADRNGVGSPGCVGTGCGENIARVMWGPRITDSNEIDNMEMGLIEDNFDGWDFEKHMYDITDDTCKCNNCNKPCGNNQTCKDIKEKCQERCNRTGPVCGHYTQNVWWETTEIGCGAALANCTYLGDDTQGYFLTCLYKVPGNAGGRPYNRNLYTTTLSASEAQNRIDECVNQHNPDDGPKHNSEDGSYEQETKYECGTDGWCWKTIKDIFPGGSWRSRSSANKKCR